MGKKKLGLPILACIFVLLLGSYVAFLNYQEQKEAKQNAENSKIYVNQMEEITSIHYVNGEIEMDFTKENDAWIVTEYPDFPLEQSEIETIEGLLENLEATRKFESSEPLENYGLTEPGVIVTAVDASGKTCTIYLGAMYESQYYAYINEEPSIIYTIGDSIVTATQKDLYDMIALEKMPVLTEVNIDTMEFVTSYGTIFVEKKIEVAEETTEETTEETQEETTEEMVWYVSINGGEMQVLSDDAKEELLMIVANAEIVDCVNYKANETQLADYGLADPGATIRITYTNEEETEVLTVFVGNLNAQEEVYYVQMDGSQAVNCMREGLLEYLMNGKLDVLE